MDVWFRSVTPALLARSGILLAASMGMRAGKAPAVTRRSIRYRTGQLVAIAASLTVCGLLVTFFLFNPYRPVTAELATLTRMSPTAISAVLACIAGVVGSSALLIGAFSLGFFPWWIGLYLLGTPGLFKWIPIAELGYLVAAGLMARGGARSAGSH